MNRSLQHLIAGVVLIGCAGFVFWRDRKRKTIEHEPAPPAPAPAPAPAPRADDPDPARPGAAA